LYTQKKLDELAGSLNNLAKSATEVIGNKQNQQNFEKSLVNLTEATKQATETLKEFQNFSAASREAVQAIRIDFEKISTDIGDTSAELSATARELRLVLEKVNNGEGSAARFLNDARLYENLLDGTEELEMVLEQLRRLLSEWKNKGMKHQL